jgi:xanthine dehydrogenase accessory factor
MLVWADGFAGTIGGGALEWRALDLAREVLTQGGRAKVERMPLGPGLGQCCGGAVTLVIERMEQVPPVPWLRRLEGQADAPSDPFEGFQEGWMCEGTRPPVPLWIWGAGHVGRALVDVLVPMPGVALTWVDIGADRFPEVPKGVSQLIATAPERAMPHAPTTARHLILTHSHEIDLALCHAALLHQFAWCGLIGSKTKWARFRSRLADLGHRDAEIYRITCPIGDPGLGKHPQAIAVGVVAGLLSDGVLGDG